MPPYIQSLKTERFNSTLRHRPSLLNLILFVLILLTATGYSYKQTLLEHPRTPIETVLQTMVNAGAIFSLALVARLAEKAWR